MNVADAIGSLLLQLASLTSRLHHADVATLCERRDARRAEVLALIARGIPVVIRGGAASWPAVHRWTADFLCETLAGSIGVGCSTDLAFQTRRVAIRQMDVATAIRMIHAEPDGATRYYLKNVRLRKTDLRVLCDDLGDLDYFPDDAHEPRPPRGERPPPSPILWMGQRGTYTPLHYDPDGNWIVLLRGCKRVQLVSPVWSAHVHPEPITSRVFWYSRATGAQPDLGRARILETDLAPGDCLYIPPGWWHLVSNLQASIAVTYYFQTRTWGRLRYALNPAIQHSWLNAPYSMYGLSRFLHDGTGADMYAKDLNISAEALRAQFDRMKRSWNPLYRLALAGAPTFEQWWGSRRDSQSGA